jgi:transcriptional regulator of arginine metabolism
MVNKEKFSTSARRALVIATVNTGEIHSQEELVKALAKVGVSVTQATASRDLEEVGAVRGPDNAGVVRYQILQNQSAAPSQVSSQLFLEMRSAGNQIVIRTPAGGAQLLAGTIDRAVARGDFPNILGTIAGDDTVLVIAQNESQCKIAIKRIEELFVRKRSRQ